MMRLTIVPFSGDDGDITDSVTMTTEHAYVMHGWLVYRDPDDAVQMVYVPSTSFLECRIRPVDVPPAEPAMPALSVMCVRPSCGHARRHHHDPDRGGGCSICEEAIPCPGFCDDPAALAEEG